MNDTAYVLVAFKIVNGKPEFLGVDIFSERNPTVMGGIVYTELMSSPGATFEEAIRNAIEDCRRWYPWVIPLLPKRSYL